MNRAVDKKRKILRFLRDETWTNVRNIELLLEVGYLTAHRTLTYMKRDGLVKSESFKGLGGQFMLWGITPHGLGMAYEEDEPMLERPYFDRSKVTISTVNHTLDLQAAQLRATKAGWQEWLNGRFIGNSHPDKRPDALVTSPEGHKVAIEIERTIKTRKRYEQVISTYLQAIKQKDYDYVIYLSPTEITSNLERFFRQINEVPVHGQRIAITEKHHEKFKFYALENWLSST